MTDIDTIKVSLFRRSGSRTWHLQFRDPETGDKRRKSTGTHIKRDSERNAAKWESEVRSGKDQSKGRIAWDVFRERYENYHLSGLADKTEKKVMGVLNVLERFRKPRQLRNVTTSLLTEYVSYLRSQKRSENTIKGHVGHIRGALQWAVDNDLLDSLPTIPKIKRAKHCKVMKGRPVTTEEFERMLESCKKVILTANTGRAKKSRTTDATRVPSWQFLLRGIWLSGLRLSESIDLHWTDSERIRIDMDSQRYPMFRIPAASEKGNKEGCFQ